MAETITLALNAMFSLSTSYDLTVTDDQGIARTVTIGTAATTTYWWPFIAPNFSGASTPSTTTATPVSLCAHIKKKLNAGGSSIWNVYPNAAGFIVITYSGVVRAGSITWPDAIVRNVLGITGNTGSISMGGGTYTATYHPTHCAYFLGASNATNWGDVPPMSSIDESPDGSTYGLTDSQGLRTYTFDGLYHPLEWSTRTTLGIASTDASATPIWGDSSRWKTRSATAGVTPPWGLNDFFHACRANNSVAGKAMCSALLGTFQDFAASTASTFDEVYIAADTLQKDNAAKPSVANWNARMHWPGIKLRQYATGVSF